MSFPRSRRALLLIAAGCLGLLLVPGASLLYEASAGQSCTRCHEIRQSYDVWRNSSHRGMDCKECHGGLLTLDVSFHTGNLRRLSRHLRAGVPERVEIRNRDVGRLMERCQGCHREEFAQWQSGPHSATYARIFLDVTDNQKRRLMEDCLRCHGMFFDGGIRDLVAPLNTAGPWRLIRPELAEQPAIPCLACHAMHRDGVPLKRRQPQVVQAAAGQELFRPSLALFDIRTREHLPTAYLPLPEIREGSRPVKMSPDRRQALCYQCHAPLATWQVRSGDDRTPVGVHEGFSCLACHQKHSQQTRASCADCHPRLSNCGLDVEKMDTTFRSPKSPHNIHFVKCADCHPKGVPPKRGQKRVAD